ncbi:hypothetical protein MPSEU_000990900 [Mayamaea pseudoterrestris]|nr:hypothetical protein MPSEU_000990900 [Mayamaea pseudoterrestris]
MSSRKSQSSNVTITSNDELLAFSTLSVDQLAELQSHLKTRLASLIISPPPPPPKRRKQSAVSKDSAIDTASTDKGTADGAGSTAKEEEIGAETTEASAAQNINTADSAADINQHDDDIVPVYERITDTHHDFMLKELQWLAADFSGERTRHVSRRKQLSASMKQHYASQEHRHLQQLAQAELNRRKLAAKISRDFIQRQWWDKMNRLISLQQKQSLQRSQAAAMNKQLVQLVQLTEKYTKASLTNSNAKGENGLSVLTIEQALAKADSTSTRRSKLQVTDYARLEKQQQQQQMESDNDSILYGESTTASDESADDESYAPSEESDASDDETTLVQAEQEERAILRQREGQQSTCDKNNMDGDDDAILSFQPDPIELRMLQEEATMPIDQVLQRLAAESDGEHADLIIGELPPEQMDTDEDLAESRHRRVRFSNQERINGHDRDYNDDGVQDEDYIMSFMDTANNDADDDDGSDEFVADDEVDDETTLAQEEALPREMTAQEEIDLLQMEGNMSIEELRRQYAGIHAQQEQDSSEGESHSDVELDVNIGDTTTAEPDADISQLLHRSVTAAEEVMEEDLGEFHPDADAIDDETTMEAEERLGRDMPYEEELAMLQREGEMSLEELRALYLTAGDAVDGEIETPDVASASVLQLLDSRLAGEDLKQEEYVPEGDEMDDETTMDVEERLGRDMSYDDELSLLKREGDMSIEELRERYLHSAGDRDEDSASINQSDSDTSSTCSDDIDSADADEADAAMQALEASSELARHTLASRPFLLSSWVKLREYQQIGLNWLVSLQTRRLNGILADEMGLGKTLQTISLFGYLAAYKGIWGPHLVVVPTSVLLNWETELKRFCPGLKVLCYYGSAKRRKELRQGWTKSNWFHVVLTSYQLAVQDAFAFKRKKWYYLVLDEAQNIKNFQSQRWQTLINFNTQRRLLLTGTPLQNNLLELWSLLHFLMPYVFRSRKEFSYWFANPMTGIVEGRSQNEDVVNRLHGIIRPFVLRRLKKDVESQMPGKFEHIVKCQLSRRQMFIYEEFMARSSTRQSLKKGGNFMDMMNVLMQLRKVCNHPDLFEPRPVVTSFVMESIALAMPSQILDVIGPLAEDTVSHKLISPLWSGSNGVPSTDAALKHDFIESEALMALREVSMHDNQNTGGPTPIISESSTVSSHNLALLWLELANQRRQEEADKLLFFDRLNSSRCSGAPFPFSSRFIKRTSILAPSNIHDDVLTPISLLRMRHNQLERAKDVDHLVKKFVFCVPKATARRPLLAANSTPSKNAKQKKIEEMLLEPLEAASTPFQEADARLSASFPDKNLIQFDAGKLQVLAELLRELKRGGHRVLIFTQMSKMLDILEAFLNLHGYTYMRLDGSTSVDRRQRLMDRFNSDDKVFCFILSTRSGGLGINLVGADTVIFYDSDWNSAMDAQAQDRAHRIGQTREVHIYRLVTQHTIEENILLKAQQKRKLDMLVMDKGHFDSSQLFGHQDEAKATLEPADSGKLFTAGGLRDILGVNEDEVSAEAQPMDIMDAGMSNEDMEKAMTTLEDDDDVIALRGAQKEAAEDLREFDETVEIRNRFGSDDEADEEVEEKPASATQALKSNESFATNDTDEQKKTDEELEKEFEAWQDKGGVDFTTLTASLGPVERYSLRFRQDVDPFYSVFAITEYNQKIEAANERVEEIDYASIEREKALEEQLALENGDLLGTFPQPDDLVRQRALYQREKCRLRARKLRRRLTGEAWEVRHDAVSGLPYWHNSDTGETSWDKPMVLEELEAYDLAIEKRFDAMPNKSLLLIMEFLVPYPDRMSCAGVSRRWRIAATCPSFVKHVYPVELGAYTREDSKIEHNHFRTITDALAAALPGDTVELGDGHYWINEEHVRITIPLRIIGDEEDPSNVLVEVANGTIHWEAPRGYCEGVTFRRPIMAAGEALTKELFSIDEKGKIDVICSVFDNAGSAGIVVNAKGRGMKGVWRDVVINGGSIGLFLSGGSGFGLIGSIVRNQAADGIVCDERSKIVLTNCKIQRVGNVAVRALRGSKVKLNSCTSKDIGGEICFADEESSVDFA